MAPLTGRNQGETGPISSHHHVTRKAYRLLGQKIDLRYPQAYYLSPTGVSEGKRGVPSLAEFARVISAGACIEASFKRGKGETGMDAYQVHTWQGWHHHMALSLIAV